MVTPLPSEEYGGSPAAHRPENADTNNSGRQATDSRSTAIAVFDEQGSMRSVEFLNPPNQVSDCKGSRVSGTIRDVEFDAAGRITGLRLKAAFNRKPLTLYLWFPEEAYVRLKATDSKASKVSEEDEQSACLLYSVAKRRRLIL